MKNEPKKRGYNMHPQRNVISFLIAVHLAAVLLLVGPVHAQQLPRGVTIGSNPLGTTFYVAASGLSKVVTEAARLQMVVQPYTGSSTFLPLLNTGELDFGVVNGVEALLSYQGPARFQIAGRNPLPHAPNIRLVMRGALLIGGLLVKKDSPLKSVHDLKGKRVTGEYPAQLAAWYVLTGLLATGGLRWSDVRVIPVPGVNEGIDALVQGRADVTSGALNAAKTREADAAVGVRHLSADCSPEGYKRVQKAIPGMNVPKIKAGTAVAVIEDTCMVAADMYLSTGKAAADQVVASVLKAIWDNVEKLPPLHPLFKDWTRERAVDLDVAIPYHPAAMQFYKERGVWSAKMDEAQRKLLAVNP
ncbi:MAG: TAXI family TRAP transporter solute-binding subunit [Deltaproteobacteria bacterium]|nr:TAXI family TRAP transporter solute-binding subunit [Deltaproteobacteria bacterium]